MQRWLLLGAIVLAGCGDDSGVGSDANGGDDGGGGGGGDGGTDDALVDSSDPPLDGPISDCPAATWCLETVPDGTPKLNGVFARTVDDVFAVGDGGAILRRQSGTWAAMASGTTTQLRAVWAASATDAWAVGLSGTVLRWNGATWAAAGPAAVTTAFDAVWGTSATDVWVVGGTAAHRWDGATWTPYGLSGTAMLDIHGTGTGANELWIGSEGGYAKRWTGSAWSTDTSSYANVFAIRVLASNDVWITTAEPDARRWNGTTWTPHAVSSTLVSLYASGASDVWGVAVNGSVAHWAGSSWTIATPSVITQPLRAIAGAGTSLWAVGDGGTIAHRHP